MSKPNSMDKLKEREERRRKTSTIATLAGLDEQSEPTPDVEPEKEIITPVEQPQATIKAKDVVTPPAKETRNKKVLVLLTPTLKAKAEKKAKAMKISLNEAINQLLASWVE